MAWKQKNELAAITNKPAIPGYGGAHNERFTEFTQAAEPDNRGI